MFKLGAAEGWVVTQDGETLKTGFASDFEAVSWLHKRHSFSVDYAVEHAGYDIVLIENGKVTYSYKKEAQRRKGRSSMGGKKRGHVLGLHSEEERRNAYTMARRMYQRALKDLAGGSGPRGADYAMGYIEAIADLLHAEAEDPELLQQLVDMRDELLTKAAEAAG